MWAGVCVCVSSYHNYNLKDQMTLKRRGPIPFYYESLHGLWTFAPFRVLFVLKETGDPSGPNEFKGAGATIG